MNLLAIILDCVMLFMVLIVLYGVLFENRSSKPKSRQFTRLVVVTSLVIGLDLVACTMDQWGYYGIWSYLATGCVLLSGETLAWMFVYYVMLSVNEKTRAGYLPARLAGIPALGGQICVAVLILLGKVFTYEDGVYTTGPLYVYIFLPSLATVLYGDALSLIYRAALGWHDTCAMLAYGVLPLVCLAVEYIAGIPLSHVGLGLGVLLVYVMLQSGEISEGAQYKQMLYRDLMTGVGSRHSYEARKEQLKPGSLGVIFCDVNGLKYTNDRFGHSAGDQLIMRCAKLLRQYFDTEDIFRPSGDEFVVLCGGKTREAFEKAAEGLKRDVAVNGKIASLGDAYGDEGPVELLHRAEEIMYRDKDRWYESMKDTLPPDRRRGET